MENDRKTRQLCRQVAETLQLVLDGECRDERLGGLVVVEVRAAPNASQLLVTVSPASGADCAAPGEVLERLAAASGFLRSEVARSICRRRAPRLLFQYQPLVMLPSNSDA